MTDVDEEMYNYLDRYLGECISAIQVDFANDNYIGVKHGLNLALDILKDMHPTGIKEDEDV